MSKLIILILCFSGAIYSADETVNSENIESVSRSIIREYFSSDDKIYDRMKSLWVKSDKTNEIINTLKGQDLQYKSKAIEHFEITDTTPIILIGSKTLPIAVKIVYVLDAGAELVPISLTWLVKDGAYRLFGVNWGMSQCKDDLTDLSVKSIGFISGPLKNKEIGGVP